jgi:thiol:disulfide interchange protein DsbD
LPLAPQSSRLSPAPGRSHPATSVALSLEAAWNEALNLSLAQLGIAAPNPNARTLWLMARFRPPKGTHIYWSNPGETGLPTLATFEAPQELSVGQVLYPGPERFRSERGSTSYGYGAETALFAPVSVPEGISLSDKTFRVIASWLSCSEWCVKESASVTLQF